MITFREFLNMQDRMPQALSLKPQFSGLNVTTQFKDFLKPPSAKPPTPSTGGSVALPTLGMSSGRSNADKAIPNKPHRFLPRKGSTLRKGF